MHVCTHRHRHRHRHRHTDTQTHRHTDTQTHKHTDINTKTHMCECVNVFKIQTPFTRLLAIFPALLAARFFVFSLSFQLIKFV
jgi:hypothetical protein